MLRRPPRARPRSWRALSWVAPLLGLTCAVSACTGHGGSPGPTEEPGQPGSVAAALAAGIAKQDVSAVPFAQTTGAAVNTRLRPLVSGLDPLRPRVSVGAIDTSGDQASAVLHYAWAFPGVARQWTYDSTAQLVREGGQWKASFQPSVVQPGLDGSNRLSGQREQGDRGKILGQDGDAIVKPRPVARIGIDKTKVRADRQATSATRLATLVGIDPKRFAAQVTAAAPQDFVEAIVLRADADHRPSNRAVYRIPGAAVFSGDAMLAPSRTFARALLGSVGPASKELVDESKGAVSGGDQVGRSGLQLRYDEQLRGTPGVTVRLVPAGRTAAGATPSPSSGGPSASPSGPSSSPSTSASTAPATTVFATTPVAGRDLSTTLSIPLQNLAEKTLASTKPASALVALRPSTGEVLAAANGPGSEDHQLATTGRFPPGSTFKVASSLALLRAGLTPRSAVTCPATVTVNGKKFTNYSDYPPSQRGNITLRTALAQSCNTAFIGQRGKLGANALAEAAASLGLGRDYDIGFSSFFGSVPPDGTATGRAAAMIGQGRVLASPLAMASVVASVSAGKTVLPSLVVGHRAVPAAGAAQARPLTRAEADDLREMMGAVVSEGSGRVLQKVSGPRIIAKTGTAEFGAKAPFQTHAWMIAAQGDLAVAVFVDVGRSGSHTAGPLLAKFLSGAR